jgi:hypothetical protein
MCPLHSYVCNSEHTANLNTPEAVQVEDMATVQLLVEALLGHLLTADDADAIAACQVLSRGIREAVHARRDLPAGTCRQHSQESWLSNNEAQ